jgi:D-glycero-D-manno-heptose 1,7-bisphosphate phosphatase
MMKLIILDRDGVINKDSPEYIKSPAEWEAIPGSLEAITRLNHLGYRVVVATNQSGLARGLYDEAILQAIHDKMRQQLASLGGKIDQIFFCPHHPDDACDCRKPKPGLLMQIKQHYQCELNNVPLVGDSLRDMQAAEAVGCRPILVLTGNGRNTLLRKHEIKRIEVYDDLQQVADILSDETDAH